MQMVTQIEEYSLKQRATFMHRFSFVFGIVLPNIYAGAELGQAQYQID